MSNLYKELRFASLHPVRKQENLTDKLQISVIGMANISALSLKNLLDNILGVVYF